jgi:hypothetical protein
MGEVRNTVVHLIFKYLTCITSLFNTTYVVLHCYYPYGNLINDLETHFTHIYVF